MSEQMTVREKYRIGNSKYLFFISTIQPRKNIPGLVEAFAKLLKEHPEYENLKLLIAGKKGWSYNESIYAPKKFKIERNVRFLGRIPDEDVAPLIVDGIKYVCTT